MFHQRTQRKYINWPHNNYTDNWEPSTTEWRTTEKHYNPYHGYTVMSNGMRRTFRWRPLGDDKGDGRRWGMTGFPFTNSRGELKDLALWTCLNLLQPLVSFLQVVDSDRYKHVTWLGERHLVYISGSTSECWHTEDGETHEQSASTPTRQELLMQAELPPSQWILQTRQSGCYKTHIMKGRKSTGLRGGQWPYRG